MWLRIAKEWGLSVPEAMAKFPTVGDFLELKAFFRIEPWGYEALDMMFARQTTMIVNGLLSKRGIDLPDAYTIIRPPPKKRTPGATIWKTVAAIGDLMKGRRKNG